MLGPLLAVILGVALIARTVLSAIRTFVVPRGENDALTAFVFRAVRLLFNVLASPKRPYATRDRAMAYYGPVTLMVLPATWLMLLVVGFGAIYWALGLPVADALEVSGSSLLTLGFFRPAVPFGDFIAFAEAAIGLALVALLISYLPTIYGAFSRRELLVNLLEVRADSPPSPVVMITRMHRLHGLDALHDLWVRWEQWFAEVEESHSSLPVLVHYRSQQPAHSWVNAAGAIMDAAALMRSSVDAPPDVQEDLVIRAGYLALRRVATPFGIAYDPNPLPTDATSITRGQFDHALEVIAAAGVPLVADREQAWRDFNGWRVNYDQVLRGLETLTMAPTPWWDRPMQSAWATDDPSVRVDVTSAAREDAVRVDVTSAAREDAVRVDAVRVDAATAVPDAPASGAGVRR